MILVTGASGYIGSHVTRRLVEEGKPVRAMVRDRQFAQDEGRLKGLPIEWVEGDVTRPDTLAPVFAGVNAVIHLVAIAIEKGSRTYEEINYQGTVNVVDAATAAGVNRFLNMSQLGASSKLPYRFLASKGKAQEYVAASSLDWTAFRPSVIWGPEDGFANTFARLVPLTPVIFPIVGGKEARFQPVWVEDVATCFVKALDDPETIHREFEIAGPEVLILEEIERRTLVAIEAKRWMIRFPMPLLRVVVSLMESLLPQPPVTRSLLELLSVSNVPAHNAVYQFVGNPRPFTSENVSSYMREFNVRQTIRMFMGKPY
jgi:NADH dehydrogenase